MISRIQQEAIVKNNAKAVNIIFPEVFDGLNKSNEVNNPLNKINCIKNITAIKIIVFFIRILVYRHLCTRNNFQNG
jgi:hypothetical protein